MPELPEVETTARGLRDRLIGRRVVGVAGVDWPRMLPNASADAIATALAGRAVTQVSRRGKYLLLLFEAGLSLALHRKMSGNVLLQRTEEPAAAHTHFILRFSGGLDLRFVDARKFGRIHLFSSDVEREQFLGQRLGPEPLTDLDGAILGERLRGRRRAIKTLLLDQSVVAGVGNLYADEALWEARIHPERGADSLTRPELRRLAAAIKRVLELGIERRGTSFSNYLDADGAPGTNQDYLNVYGRAARPCPRCGTPVSRVRLGARSSHFCARCQRAARPDARRAAIVPASGGEQLLEPRGGLERTDHRQAEGVGPPQRRRHPL